ncbi:alpha-amylase [Peribacillus asahii]|uniref:Alpha-amylase n=1 Tax=Peribacillus asahii TaxID=228899 RepID=A0A3Q9RNE5_9BACI|nr:hypothetical protein [Peribacillus asahii]AZV43684.1 alpha-amylase [Peribacillus asahii]
MKKLMKIFITSVIALSFCTFNSSVTEAAKKASYLQNTKKVYVFNDFIDGVKRTYNLKYTKKSNGNYFWQDKLSYKEISYAFKEKETTKGLYHDGYLALAYPIKKGKTWKTWSGTVCKTTSTNKTIKVKAGTFKNVIEVTCDHGSPYPGYPEYSKFYYVKSVGKILTKYTYTTNDSKGNKVKDTVTLYELVKLKNR